MLGSDCNGGAMVGILRILGSGSSGILGGGGGLVMLDGYCGDVAWGW